MDRSGRVCAVAERAAAGPVNTVDLEVRIRGQGEDDGITIGYGLRRARRDAAVAAANTRRDRARRGRNARYRDGVSVPVKAGFDNGRWKAYRWARDHVRVAVALRSRAAGEAKAQIAVGSVTPDPGLAALAERRARTHYAAGRKYRKAAADDKAGIRRRTFPKERQVTIAEGAEVLVGDAAVLGCTTLPVEPGAAEARRDRAVQHAADEAAAAGRLEVGHDGTVPHDRVRREGVAAASAAAGTADRVDLVAGSRCQRERRGAAAIHGPRAARRDRARRRSDARRHRMRRRWGAWNRDVIAEPVVAIVDQGRRIAVRACRRQARIPVALRRAAAGEAKTKVSVHARAPLRRGVIVVGVEDGARADHFARKQHRVVTVDGDGRIARPAGPGKIQIVEILEGVEIGACGRKSTIMYGAIFPVEPAALRARGDGVVERSADEPGAVGLEVDDDGAVRRDRIRGEYVAAQRAAASAADAVDAGAVIVDRKSECRAMSVHHRARGVRRDRPAGRAHTGRDGVGHRNLDVVAVRIEAVIDEPRRIAARAGRPHVGVAVTLRRRAAGEAKAEIAIGTRAPCRGRQVGIIGKRGAGADHGSLIQHRKVSGRAEAGTERRERPVEAQVADVRKCVEVGIVVVASVDDCASLPIEPAAIGIRSDRVVERMANRRGAVRLEVGDHAAVRGDRIGGERGSAQGAATGTADVIDRVARIGLENERQDLAVAHRLRDARGDPASGRTDARDDRVDHRNRHIVAVRTEAVLAERRRVAGRAGGVQMGVAIALGCGGAGRAKSQVTFRTRAPGRVCAQSLEDRVRADHGARSQHRVVATDGEAGIRRRTPPIEIDPAGFPDQKIGASVMPPAVDDRAGFPEDPGSINVRGEIVVERLAGKRQRHGARRGVRRCSKTIPDDVPVDRPRRTARVRNRHVGAKLEVETSRSRIPGAATRGRGALSLPEDPVPRIDAGNDGQSRRATVGDRHRVGRNRVDEPVVRQIEVHAVDVFEVGRVQVRDEAEIERRTKLHPGRLGRHHSRPVHARRLQAASRETRSRPKRRRGDREPDAQNDDEHRSSKPMQPTHVATLASVVIHMGRRDPRPAGATKPAIIPLPAKRTGSFRAETLEVPTRRSGHQLTLPIDPRR